SSKILSTSSKPQFLKKGERLLLCHPEVSSSEDITLITIVQELRTRLSINVVRARVQLKALSCSIVPSKVPSSRYASAVLMSTASDRRTGPVTISALKLPDALLSFNGLPPKKSLKEGIMKSCEVLGFIPKCSRKASSALVPTFILCFCSRTLESLFPSQYAFTQTCLVTLN